MPALTGVRFLAALAVFLHHLPAPNWLPAPARTFMASGHNGVTLFFVLSGFVIALNYFGRLRRPTVTAVWNYAVGRFARVYPLYLAVLVFVVLAQGAPGLWRLPWHLLAAQAWSPDRAVAFAYNAPGWSIGVEFFLYACFPLLVLALAPIAHRASALWLAGGVVLVVLLVVSFGFQYAGLDLPPSDPASAHRWVYRTPLLRLGDFTVGVLAALLFRHRRGSGAARTTGELATWGPVLVIVALMCWPGKAQYVARLDALWVVPAAALFLGLARHPGASLSRALSTPALVVLGDTSFAFYLVHRPLQHAFRVEALVDEPAPVYAGFCVLLVAVTAVLAIGLRDALERPARRWLSARLMLRPPGTSLLIRGPEPVRGAADGTGSGLWIERPGRTPTR